MLPGIEWIVVECWGLGPSMLIADGLLHASFLVADDSFCDVILLNNDSNRLGLSSY